jgi:hypothetical protein
MFKKTNVGGLKNPRVSGGLEKFMARQQKFYSKA